MTFSRALAVALLAGSTSIALAQVDFGPPTQVTPTPGPTPATPANDTPGTAATLPSAEAVLNNLLKDKSSTVASPSTAAPSSPNAVPPVEAVAPNEPAASKMREGQSIYSRVGRLVKDEKTGKMLFSFDADGKKMYDPPMEVIPCKYLAVMEDASENGSKPTKFRISAEVTQYRGKNYLYIKFVTTVRDLNQGLGG